MTQSLSVRKSSKNPEIMGFFMIPVIFWLVVNVVFAQEWFVWLANYVLVVRHGIGTNDIFYITVALSVSCGLAIFLSQRKRHTPIAQSAILAFAIPIISVVVFEYTYDIGKMIWHDPLNPPFYETAIPFLTWILILATWILLPLFAYRFHGKRSKSGFSLILLALACFLIWFGEGMPLIAASVNYPVLALNIIAKSGMIAGYSLLFL